MKNRPEDETTGGRFTDGLLMPIFAVAAVFLFVILCFYAYNNVMKNKDNNNQVVVLDGDNSAFKVAPQNPGGMEVEHTNKAVFNTVTGQQENTENGIKVESQEAPVSQEQLAKQADNSAPNDIKIPNEGESANVAIDPAQGSVNPAAGGNAEDADTGSSNVAEDVAPTAPEVINTSSNEEKLKALKSETVKSPAPVTVEATPKEKKTVPVKLAPVETTAKEEPKKPASKMVNAEVKKETDKKTGESKTVINFKEAPKSMKGAVAPASMKGSASASAGGSGSYYVQVSSSGSRSEAESSWESIKSKYSAEIGNASKNIAEADVKGKTVYRLSFGPFPDKGTASTKCGILKAKGHDCIIQKY